MEGKVQMAKIDGELKDTLKTVAISKQKSMTDLVKEQLRYLLKSNGLPTI